MASPRPVKWPKAVLFGDSLTQFSFGFDGGWGAILADHLQRKCDVVARGFSGYNSRMCLAVLPHIFSEGNVDDIAAVTVLLGSNDSADEHDNPQQHVPLAEYEKNLVSIIKYLEEVGISKEKVVILTPPPVDDGTWIQELMKKGKKPYSHNHQTAEYAEACQAVAKQTGCECVDLYTTIIRQKSWSKFFCDGLHFSKTGAKFVAAAVLPHLEKRTSHLPLLLPVWDELDAKNPENTIAVWMSEHTELL